MFFGTPPSTPKPRQHKGASRSSEVVYNFEIRNMELLVIKAMPAGIEKQVALNEFIVTETDLLQPTGLIRSPLLTSAEKALSDILAAEGNSPQIEFPHWEADDDAGDEKEEDASASRSLRK